MAVPPRYNAVWIPGLRSDFDVDEALLLGERWLRHAPAVNGRIVVMNAAKMAHNNPTLARLSASVQFVSPRTRNFRPPRPLAVLAIYPTNETLDFAETLALDGALCVIPGTIDEVSGWIARSRATNLAAPDDEPPALRELHPDVCKELNGLIFFGGHNDFYGGYEKDRAIGDLRDLVRHGHQPAAADVELYALATGKVRSPKGAARLREWYEGILAGKWYKGERGQRI